MRTSFVVGIVAILVGDVSFAQTGNSRKHTPARLDGGIVHVRGQIDDDEILPVGATTVATDSDAGIPDDGPIIPADISAVSRTANNNPPLSLRLVEETSPPRIRPEPATCEHCQQPLAECKCHGCGLTVFGEWLFLQPRGADPVFAVRSLTCTTPPIGTEQIDFGSFSGFKGGFAKALHDGCSELVASFTTFDSTEDGRASPTSGTSVIRPVVTFDPFATCNDATSATARATAGIDFDRIDLDYRSFIDCGCTRFDWLVGFGYGQLNQDLRAVFDESRVAVDADMWGYGIRLGGGATCGKGCIRAYGHADLTLLASNVKTHFRETDRGNGVSTPIANFDQDQDRIVPVVDLEFGIASNLCRNTVLKVGYTYSIWFNVVTTPEFIEAVQHNDVTGTSDTLTFDGVFARVEYTW